jgi:selenocysteine lyase/cysteine desulfurase
MYSARLPKLALFRGVGAIFWKNLVVARRSKRELILACAFTLIYTALLAAIRWGLRDAMSKGGELPAGELADFDNGVMLDAARLGAACHAQGTLLLLDVSQCCGAIPIDVNQLGADFMVSAGYKWLLGPFGTGFFWAKSERISKMRPGPFYWMAAEGAETFSALNFADPKPAQAARRWDAAETANYYNLAALDAGLDLVLRIGKESAPSTITN